MTSTNGSSNGSSNGSDPGVRGPVLGTAADVGRIGEAGLRAAASVVEQVLLLSRQLTEVRFPAAKLGGPDGVAPEADSPTGDRRRDLRTLRADAERLIELYGDWTRALVDGVTALAEGAEQAGPDEELVLGPVAAGEVVTTSLWLHTFEGPVGAHSTLHVTDLVSHRREVVPGSAVAFSLPAVDSAEANASVEITLTVTVPTGTPDGTYRGWALADGLPEIALPVRLEVG